MDALLKYLASSHWVYLAYAIPFMAFMLVFYLKYKQDMFVGLRNFILWIKPSFETAGQASPEKLTAFALTVFAYIPNRWVYSLRVTDPLHLLYAFVLDGIIILILYRIISPAQLIELREGKKIEEKI